MTKLFKEEYQDMGLLNHSIAQARLVNQLSYDDKFTPVVELRMPLKIFFLGG